MQPLEQMLFEVVAILSGRDEHAPSKQKVAETFKGRELLPRDGYYYHRQASISVA